jgi:multimeric flavodoxin WrbA
MAEQTYRVFAERARNEAAEATLDNVRDRALRSEAAWLAMAERAERGERLRRDRLPAA